MAEAFSYNQVLRRKQAQISKLNTSKEWPLSNYQVDLQESLPK